ncbi:MAG: nucleotide exchange factor GrpE [Candidatus Saccharimonadales bacterium]
MSKGTVDNQRQSAADKSTRTARSVKSSPRGDKKLARRINDLEQEVATLSSDVKRERADFMNYKRRSELDRLQIMQVATEQVVGQLLPLFDDLERALAAVPRDLAEHPWAKGVSQIHRQVQAKLGELGVNRINCVGQPFDPGLHEAVGFEDGEGADDVVTEELRPGYRLGEAVLRPSMVKVGKADTPDEVDNDKQIKEGA